MDVLRHEDVSIDPGMMPRPNLLQCGFYDSFGMDFLQIWKAVKAAECDEVKEFGSLVPLETVRHGFRVMLWAVE
jgi:hypothetical protein